MSQSEETSGSLDEEARRRRSARQRRLLEDQRDEILRAVGEVVVERGLLGASVSEVARRAFVSPKTFERLFGSLDECFGAFVEEGVALAMRRISGPSERSWSDGVLSGLAELLAFLDAQPSLAHVLLIEAIAIPDAFEKHMLPALRNLVTLLDQARSGLPDDEQPPALTGEGIVFGIAGILRLRLMGREAPPFIDLLGELAALVVAPYLGAAEAAQVRKQSMERAIERKHEPPLQAGGRTQALPVQLTRPTAHRARAVLRYVAAHPGTSNKEIGRAAEIEHLGQVSTLLGRLEEVGLLVKRAGGPGKPNAWGLSPKGEDAARTLGHKQAERPQGS